MNFTSISELEPRLPEALLARRVVHLLNFSAIRASSGVLWEKLSKAVSMHLESILKRTLAAQDFSAIIDDTRAVIVTPSVDSLESATTALHIAYDLTFGILGHCDADQIRIEKVVSCVNGNLTTVPLSPEELSRLVERAQLADVGGLSAHRRAAPEAAKSKIVVSAERSGLAIEHAFEPVWDAKHEAISTYICVPERMFEKGTDTAVTPDELTLKERSVVELSCISMGIGYLSEFVEAGDRFILGLPLNFETLCSPNGRMEFVRLCRGLPTAYRPYLLFLLSGVPLGVTQSRLSDLASLIRPFGRVAASVASGCRNFNAYQGLGFCALTIDTSQPANAQLITRDIVHVAAAASNARMGSVALGLSDEALVNQACAADIQMLQGPAVAASVDAPRRMTRLRREKVLQLDDRVSEEWF